MNPSNRSMFFAVLITTLTILGIIACVNLISSSRQFNINPDDLASQSISTNESSDSVPSKVIVAQDPFISSSTSSVSPINPVKPTAPKITAAAYLVGNIKTGKIYLSSNMNKVSPVASMSKLMTAIVATNRFSSTTIIEVTPADMEVATDTSAIGVGEKFTLKEILYPLLLNSSNIAAEAISSTDISSSSATSSVSNDINKNINPRLSFLDDMSNTAWEINMPSAYFADPSGLDAHNQASAKDMFALARYLYSSRPDILAITRIVHTSVATTTDHFAHNFDSIHPFVKDSRFIGGKTGRTLFAGETMLTILNIGGQPIAFIVLHSDLGARAYDTNILISKYSALK